MKNKLTQIIALTTIACVLILTGCAAGNSKAQKQDSVQSQASQAQTANTETQAENNQQNEQGAEPEQVGETIHLEWDANAAKTIKATFDGTTLAFTGTGELNPFGDDWLLVDQSFAPWTECVGQIKEVVVGEGITRMGLMSLAFLGFDIELELPASLANLAKPIANYSTTFKSITVSPESKQFVVIGNALYYKNNSGTYELVKYATTSEDTMFSLPNDIAVSAIWRGAFEGAINLKSIDVSSSSIASIEKDAFAYCSALEELSIPSSINVDLDDIAYGSDRLETVNGATVTS